LAGFYNPLSVTRLRTRMSCQLRY